MLRLASACLGTCRWHLLPEEGSIEGQAARHLWLADGVAHARQHHRRGRFLHGGASQRAHCAPVQPYWRPSPAGCRHLMRLTPAPARAVQSLGRRQRSEQPRRLAVQPAGRQHPQRCRAGGPGGTHPFQRSLCCHHQCPSRVNLHGCPTPWGVLLRTAGWLGEVRPSLHGQILRQGMRPLHPRAAALPVSLPATPAGLRLH